LSLSFKATSSVFFAAKNSILTLKKAATNNGLAKNRLTEVIELLFCYFTSVSADGTKFSC